MSVGRVILVSFSALVVVSCGGAVKGCVSALEHVRPAMRSLHHEMPVQPKLNQGGRLQSEGKMLGQSTEQELDNGGHKGSFASESVKKIADGAVKKGAEEVLKGNSDRQEQSQNK